MKSVDGGFATRLAIYGVGLLLLLLYSQSHMSNDTYIRYLTIFAVMYAYLQMMIGYKTWLDSNDVTKLLIEIRDLLKARQ